MFSSLDQLGSEYVHRRASAVSPAPCQLLKPRAEPEWYAPAYSIGFGATYCADGSSSLSDLTKADE